MNVYHRSSYVLHANTYIDLDFTFISVSAQVRDMDHGALVPRVGVTSGTYITITCLASTVLCSVHEKCTFLCVTYLS